MSVSLSSNQPQQFMEFHQRVGLIKKKSRVLSFHSSLIHWEFLVRICERVQFVRRFNLKRVEFVHHFNLTDVRSPWHQHAAV